MTNWIAEMGDQQTVMWHMDDLMVSCLNAFENTRLIHFLAKIYGNNMSVTRGKKHTYMGMDWDNSIKG
jgi:hypothetical protein